MRLKRKNKAKRPEPEFDFVAPYSLTECMDRLTHLQELRDIPFVPKIRINCEWVNDNTTKFTIQRSGPDALKVYGYLNQVDDQKTYVSGAMQTQKQTFWETGLIVAGVLVLSPFIGWITGLVLLGMLGGFVHYYKHGVKNELWRMERLLKDVLSRHHSLETILTSY